MNILEDSEEDEDTVTFMSNMLMEVMGSEVFDSAPALERSHRVGKMSDKAEKSL